VALRSVDGSTEAEFVPAANMIRSSLRYLGAEYLHRGDGVGAYLREGKTMGIPLLHPLASRLNGFRYRVAREVALPRGEHLIFLDDVGLPIHDAAPELMGWKVARLSPTSLTARLRCARGPSRPSGVEELSEAEARVLRLLASELTRREIGAQLYVSVNTIKSQTRSIFRKLGASSREQAVARARELELI
jgi:DNA-binding CsgD family transcriptional regulator